ncbi:dual specificity protein phosphatase family protein [Proteus mirabilis]|uniref:protein-tyrosine phosphatase family protein n=1 Tax=Proteus mirabilis TaxID=584 RepID=UPI0018C5EFF4|nr:protein-tyrosine phosphatase family protein [Proteus mirabilis]EKW4663005.1 dual specificity protein phosphatase family protein [Proteus mirabilis]ELB1686926.1 dual specificity protein phosphatase family protein [Proteus mirabilis]MBG2945714.1 dual specificity protein phosphatase family protein [Proteus mirabilis]MCT0124992.1 dual specificity protein phosphatase family protein [Proteus mirabilis]MDF7338278.1 dual specificity protein phosphatase family protein [Proteus mirabilis]
MPKIVSYISTKFNSVKNALGIKDTTENPNFSSVKNTSTSTIWYINDLSKKKLANLQVSKKLQTVNNIQELVSTEVLNKLYYDANSPQHDENNYQCVPNSRYGSRIPYCKKTLIESNGVLLPTNNVSVKNSPYVTFASQYPLNDKESLKHYFNMLFDNDIKTVYVLASNKDIECDLSKPDIECDRSKPDREYNKSNSQQKGFKYFREDFYSDNIKSCSSSKWDFSRFKIKGENGKVIENKNGDNEILGNERSLDCKVYINKLTKKGCDENKDINFVHIYNWEDHTAIDATKLKNTIDLIGKQLTINPTKENIAVHCLAGLGRTGEFIALMEMMKMIEAGNTKTKSLESILVHLRENRSWQLLKRKSQVDELIKFAINHNIPLVNDHIKIK